MGDVKNSCESPQVSIIIPVYNQLALTKACLDSITAHTELVSYEIIVVDDYSDEETQDYLAGRKDIIHVRNEENLRFAKSCNKGAAAAKGRYLMFLNNDTLVHRGWLSALVSRILSDASIGLVASRLLCPDGTIQHAGVVFKDEPADRPTYGLHIYRGHRGDYAPANIPWQYASITGACMLIPAELFHKLGGLDVSYGMYYEDNDLCLKVTQTGYKVIYEPASIVTHLENQSQCDTVKAGFKPAEKIFIDRWEKTLQKWGQLSQAGLPYLHPRHLQNPAPIRYRLLSVIFPSVEDVAAILKDLPDPHPLVEYVIDANKPQDLTEAYARRSDVRWFSNLTERINSQQVHKTAVGDYFLVCEKTFAGKKEHLEAFLSLVPDYLPEVAICFIAGQSAALELLADVVARRELSEATIILRRDHALRVFSENPQAITSAAAFLQCKPMIAAMKGEPALVT